MYPFSNPEDTVYIDTIEKNCVSCVHVTLTNTSSNCILPAHGYTAKVTRLFSKRVWRVRDYDKGLLRGAQISDGWWRRFLQGHPDLSLRSGDSTGYVRMNAMNEENLKNYFDLLDTVLEEKTVKTGKACVLTSAECIKIMNEQQRKKEQEAIEKEERKKERERMKIANDELAQKKKTRTSSATKEKTRSCPQKMGRSCIQEGCQRCS